MVSIYNKLSTEPTANRCHVNETKQKNFTSGIQLKSFSLLFFWKFENVQIIGEILSILKSHEIEQNFLAKPSEFKSTNVQLAANNYSFTTIANRRWSNIFSLSPRNHGNLDYVSNSHTNTSSTDNSNNNLTSSSASSRETAIHNASVSHDDATPTEIGAISVALPAMLCGFTFARNIEVIASEPKNSVDDNAEQRLATAINIGIEMCFHLTPSLWCSRQWHNSLLDTNSFSTSEIISTNPYTNPQLSWSKHDVRPCLPKLNLNHEKRHFSSQYCECSLGHSRVFTYWNFRQIYSPQIRARYTFAGASKLLYFVRVINYRVFFPRKSGENFRVADLNKAFPFKIFLGL